MKKWVKIIGILIIILIIFRTTEFLNKKDIYKKPISRFLCDTLQGNFFLFRDCQSSNPDYSIYLVEDCIDRKGNIIKNGTFIGIDNVGYPEYYYKSAHMGVDNEGNTIYHYYEDCKKFNTIKKPTSSKSATCVCHSSF